jgi:hypothetical protein
MFQLGAGRLLLRPAFAFVGISLDLPIHHYRRYNTGPNRQSDEPAMDLRERLERLGVHKGPIHLKAPPIQKPAKPGIERFIPGQVVETEYGGFFLGREDYPLAHQHGHWPLAAALDQSGAKMVSLGRDESLTQLDFRSAVFLDTETTGLAGGTGTYAFLVGLGYFEGESFRLRQFFMRDYDEELAMISELTQMLGHFSALVSFNGRAFDWPLLETRFVLSRQQTPLRDSPHLDLLHLARRLWRVRLPSCALSSLEQHVLGVQRTGDDVPGGLVPQIYFDYLRNRDPRPLIQVFYHNAQDILSMVTLAAHLGQVSADPFHGALAHGEDLYSLARFFESSGDDKTAMTAYLHALDCPMSSAEAKEAAATRLAMLYKRLGQYERAVELWRSMIGECRVAPYVELAKYHEHQRKEYEEAKTLVRRALDLARDIGDLAERRETMTELEHRLQRLCRKTQDVSPG